MLSTAHKALHHRTRWTGSKQNRRNTSYWHLQTDLTGKVKICESDCHVRKLCTANNPCSNRSSFSSVWPENDEKYSVSNIYSIQYTVFECMLEQDVPNLSKFADCLSTVSSSSRSFCSYARNGSMALTFPWLGLSTHCPLYQSLYINHTACRIGN